jgi:hypothetical protein
MPFTPRFLNDAMAHKVKARRIDSLLITYNDRMLASRHRSYPEAEAVATLESKFRSVEHLGHVSSNPAALNSFVKLQFQGLLRAQGCMATCAPQSAAAAPACASALTAAGRFRAKERR